MVFQGVEGGLTMVKMFEMMPWAAGRLVEEM